MMSYIQEAFPGCPVGGLRRTGLFLLSRYAAGLVNIVASIYILLGASNYVFHVRLQELPLPIRRSLLVMALLVCLVCSYYLFLLTCNLPLAFKLLIGKFQRCGTVLLLQIMVALFLLGVVSTCSVFYQAQFRLSGIGENYTWSAVQDLTMVFGILQQFLTTLLISVGLPVAEPWLRQLQPVARRGLVQLLPWKILLFLHHNIILPSITGTSSPLVVQRNNVLIIGIAFDVLFFIWLLFVVVFIVYELSLPCKSEQPLSGYGGKREMVRIPKKDFIYPPKSKVVTGLSPGHYALKYRGYDQERDKENKGQLRSNTIAHEQCRITFSELE